MKISKEEYKILKQLKNGKEKEITADEDTITALRQNGFISRNFDVTDYGTNYNNLCTITVEGRRAYEEYRNSILKWVIPIVISVISIIVTVILAVCF